MRQLRSYEPFDFEKTLLKNLSASAVASAEDSVNCHNAENIGKIIQAFSNGICVEKAVIKRN